MEEAEVIPSVMVFPYHYFLFVSSISRPRLSTFITFHLAGFRRSMLLTPNSCHTR